MAAGPSQPRLPVGTHDADAAARRSPHADADWRALHAAACAPYRAAGRFAWFFARGKLGRDPVFRALLERGDLPAQSVCVDIGCGQGLLASLLAAVDQAAAHGRWPPAWPAPPVGVRYLGIELQARDVQRAGAAAAGMPPLPQPPRFVCADMCTTALPPCDVVVMLDVLHYVPLPAQDALLRRVRDALQPHGRLLLRIGDASRQRGYRISQWVDRVVTMVRGHRVPPTWGRPLAAWLVRLQELGFDVRTVPMSRGTPFANVLLVADLHHPEAAPEATR